jgi:hypothetical protein
MLIIIEEMPGEALVTMIRCIGLEMGKQLSAMEGSWEDFE